MDRPGDGPVHHLEYFVLTRSGERLSIRCSCSVGADHLFNRPIPSDEAS